MLLDVQEFVMVEKQVMIKATIKRLIDSEHWSMFRHGTYYIIANDSDKTLETIVINYANTIGLVKKLWKKYTEAIYKYRTNTGKMTASDYTHLFGYLNPYYRSAYNIPKHRK